MLDIRVLDRDKLWHDSLAIWVVVVGLFLVRSDIMAFAHQFLNMIAVDEKF